MNWSGSTIVASMESRIDRIYNTVYLPVAEILADGLTGVPDVDVLRTPMRADLADTQLRIELELLYRLIAACRQSKFLWTN